MEINPNLENDLKEYIRKGEASDFLDKIYTPLKTIARWILVGYNTSKYIFCEADKESIVHDMISSGVEKLKIYKRNKKTTRISFIRLIMDQYVKQHYNFITVKKRSIFLTMPTDGGPSEEIIDEQNKTPDLQLVDNENIKELNRFWKTKNINLHFQKSHRPVIRLLLKSIVNPKLVRAKKGFCWSEQIAKDTKLPQSSVRSITAKFIRISKQNLSV